MIKLLKCSEQRLNFGVANSPARSDPHSPPAPALQAIQAILADDHSFVALPA
jgi:hypothetical protein